MLLAAERLLLGDVPAGARLHRLLFLSNRDPGRPMAFSLVGDVGPDAEPVTGREVADESLVFRPEVINY